MPSRSWRQPIWPLLAWCAFYPALALATLLIHGYHPFAEDGGLYVAGVEYTLDPTLFPHFTAFVTEHLRFSIFAPTLATAVQLTHLSLAWILLLTTLASLTLLFYAAHKLLRQCITSQPAQLAGMALLAAWATLPIAGTSLLLIDPYLTARSLSTPLTLLAAAYALREWSNPKPVLLCAFALVLAALFHPLMATYGLAFVLCLRLARLRYPLRAFTLLTIAAFITAAVLNAIAPPESTALTAAEYSRYYWFLSQWQWYERLGLVGPLLVLAALLRWPTSNNAAATQYRITRRYLIHATLALGSIATLVALGFAHENAPTHLVARLQPLRVFHLLYAIMALLLGSLLTQALLNYVQRTSRKALTLVPAMTLALFAALMFYVQRDTFPASPHLELPGHASSNPWVNAFLWARDNTPHDALFALDAHYISAHHEDAQTFRAIAERSALPDFSKDGGEASITPPLAPIWQQAFTAQLDLSHTPDTLRDSRLLPLGATWMLVDAAAPTTHPCPYMNSLLKICRLQP